LLGDPEGKFRRFTGSGGGNDLASCARRTVIIIRHEARKLKEAVSFITSPGYLRGNEERLRAGLMGGPARVITDKAVFGFDPESKRMRLEAIHPTTTLDDVLSNMGFQPIVPDDLPTTQPPTAEQLRLIREEIDPDKKYAGS
jgi:glutaconate CoA-transferase subunit B